MGNIKARTVLWYLTFVGFAVNYMIRINLNITIVDMVQQKPKAKVSNISSECTNDSESEIHLNATDLFLNKSLSAVGSSEIIEENSVDNKTGRYSIEQKLLSGLDIDYETNGFKWNEYEQGLVLGSYYWLHWITQIPGGVLAKKYGTKLVFGLANVIGCWLCFLMPIVSYWDYKALIIFRMIQGLVCGLAWPAMHHMTAQWIPPNERSKFVTAYLGSSVGIAAFYPFFGYVIAWSSWEWVFHFCGLFGTIWYLGWLYFVYDTPAKHPRISNEERSYIEKSLGTSVQIHKNMKTPWKEILQSRPVWMNVIAQWGGIWGLFTLMTQAPTYFKIIHGWNIKMTGILSGFPHIMRMLFAYVFSLFGDYLLRTEKMSRTNVRKMATFCCCIIKGCFVICLAYSGCSSTTAVIFLTLATAVHGSVSTGPLASIVDISPNHASIVLGISGMIGVIPGFISPAIVGALTLGNQTVTSWKYVFLIAAGMLLVSGILYVLFCESTLQSWNTPKDPKDKEMKMFGSKKEQLEKEEEASLMKKKSLES